MKSERDEHEALEIERHRDLSPIFEILGMDPGEYREIFGDAAVLHLPKDILSNQRLAVSGGPGPVQAGGDVTVPPPDVTPEMLDAVRSKMDVEFYLSSFQPGTEPSDPALHYLTQGWREGRDPAPWFSGLHYLATHVDVKNAGMNPFVHYCVAGEAEGRQLTVLGPKAPPGEVNDVYAAHEVATAPGPHFEDFDPTLEQAGPPRVKALAYYLPQFHACEVNDVNWGKGFTEWRNTPRGVPRFPGHIQPRIPRDLGCYDLSTGDIMARQAQLARAAGISGFCFYYYWFDGKRVLDLPVERFLNDQDIDIEFALMWANENWTRTWEGGDTEVFLQQTYREEDDIPFVDDLARHMKDRRYMRIDGRPILFIYRASHIPNSKQVVARWRSLFKDRHGLDPFMVMGQTFGDNDPRDFDFDGAYEFPPHKVLNHIVRTGEPKKQFDPRFTLNVVQYEDVVTAATADPVPDFPLIRTVFPSWDNDARRPGRSTIIADSTPEKFRDMA